MIGSSDWNWSIFFNGKADLCGFDRVFWKFDGFPILVMDIGRVLILSGVVHDNRQVMFRRIDYFPMPFLYLSVRL